MAENQFGAYNKEVLKRFTNPRNFGEIKDADGVGQVGNPVCLLPEEKIFFNPKIDEIKNAQINDKLISHTKNYNQIRGVFSRQYKGKIVTLKNCLGKVSLTPEHLVFSIKVPKEFKYLRTKNKKKLIPAWYHAGDLEKRDIVLYPVNNIEEDIDSLKIDVPKLKYDFRSKEIPSKIRLDKELLRLFGYFLAEGNVQDKITKTYISLALNINEKDISEDIRIISKNLFGIDIKTKERPKENGLIVYLYNAKLARWFKKLFGNGAEFKEIPDFLMKLPIEKQRSLIYGMWKGDGYINLERKGPRAGFVTISHNLAQQLKILLLRQGIIPSLYEENAKISKWAKHKKCYRIHIGQSDSLKIFSRIMNVEYQNKSFISKDSWMDENYLYTPVTKIDSFDYEGKVFNLEVENDHSYLTEAFAVHNCGDIMKIYFKVKDNKIKDIKFQTFGCVSAIAASDALCEIAKGRTIKEAKKITNQEILTKLKGLPSIKIHCSVLGAEGLKKAIENYETKTKSGGKK